MQLCTSLAIRYLYCISSRCYVFVQEAIKDFEFEFEFEICYAEGLVYQNEIPVELTSSSGTNYGLHEHEDFDQYDSYSQYHPI